MSIWLYPISERSGHRFELENGSSLKVSLDNYKQLVLEGRLAEDEWWGIRQNYSQVQVGDIVFVYTGDRDTGIVGYATVREKDSDSRALNLNFDFSKCRMLIEQPVPAKTVRRWIRFPRASVISLQNFQRKLERYLPWNENFYLKNTQTTFKDLRLKRRPPQRIAPKAHVRHFLHDNILDIVADLLRANGFKVGQETIGGLRVDLVGLRDTHMLIVEAKTNMRSSGRIQAREALGQLYEYRWNFRRLSKKRLDYCLWVVFQARPDTRVIEFLEDHEFLVSWIRKKHVQFASNSKKSFEQLVG